MNKEVDEANSNYKKLLNNSKKFTETANKYDLLIEKLNHLAKNSGEYKDNLAEILSL